jgi:hypothetical protein
VPARTSSHFFSNNDEGTYVTNQQLGSSTTLFAEVARPRVSPASKTDQNLEALPADAKGHIGLVHHAKGDAGLVHAG